MPYLYIHYSFAPPLDLVPWGLCTASLCSSKLQWCFLSCDMTNEGLDISTVNHRLKTDREDN